MNTKLLIVEDEPKIRIGLKDFLDFHGYEVTVAEDGLEAEAAVEETTFDLILLDLMLPKISGEELCSRWRQRGIQTPIIMLTAKGQEKDKIFGLNTGADDYMTKPFSLEELKARIEAILRRTNPSRSVGKEFSFGPWSVNVSGLCISANGKEIEISPREADIIQYFAAHKNEVVHRNTLYEKVWGEKMSEFGSRTVDIHIAKLRSKIEANTAEPKIIVTVRGMGYKYETA